MLNRCSKYGMVGLWIRIAYLAGFQDQSITAVVRSGNRTNQDDFRCLPEGVDIPVRFIEKPGDASRNIEAELFPDDGTTVRRTLAIVKKIKDLTDEDLLGTTPDTANPELVRYHLACVNNTVLPSPEDMVTIWRFEYCSNAMD